MKKLILYYTFVIVNLIVFAGIAAAQEYKIGPEDVLSVTFWQEPQLNTNVRVNQNGTIVLPVIGTITAAGLTPNELAAKIVRRISVFNRNISQASVLVTQYESNKVYVTGSVQKPGKYSFEVIPDLWKIILEAGGPTETAKLDQVKIIRGGDKAGDISNVDLSEVLKKGDLSKLPPVYPGDTIRIPGTTAGDQTTTGGISTTQMGEDVIYVYGQVAKPGGYPFTRNLGLLEAIIVAGGPNSNAKLDEVRVITQGSPYSSVATVDLDHYSKMGTPAPFLLKPGDTIFIPQKKSLFSETGIIRTVFQIMLTTAASAIVYIWIWNR